MPAQPTSDEASVPREDPGGQRLEGRGNVFRPACPHCGSKDCILDDRVKSNGWREMLVYWLMFVGAMTVTLHMRCRRCDRTFKSWKSQVVE